MYQIAALYGSDPSDPTAWIELLRLAPEMAVFICLVVMFFRYMGRREEQQATLMAQRETAFREETVRRHAEQMSAIQSLNEAQRKEIDHKHRELQASLAAQILETTKVIERNTAAFDRSTEAYYKVVSMLNDQKRP